MLTGGGHAVKLKLYMLGLLLVMGCPALSFADPVRMSIQPTGKGSFFLTGENVIGVKALDIEIDYDSSMLDNPYVLINGGEPMQIKADTPGKLFVSIFRPVADAILQVIVNFNPKTDGAGGIYHVSAITRSTTAWPPEHDTDSPSISSDTGEGSANDPSTASFSVEKSQTVPKVNPTAVPERTRGTNAPFAVAGAASPAGSDRKVHTEEMALLTRDEKSILQRFRKFKGEKGLNSFVTLFERGAGDALVVQEPAIALSDGKTPVTIKIQVRHEEGSQVAFALGDAGFISKEANEKGIVITVLPSEGTWDARLVISTGGKMIDYPLVVAPPIKFAGSINADNFIGALHAFIIDQSSALQRKNKMYLSEYIFTANYLADQSKTARPFVP